MLDQSLPKSNRSAFYPVVCPLNKMYRKKKKKKEDEEDLKRKKKEARHLPTLGLANSLDMLGFMLRRCGIPPSPPPGPDAPNERGQPPPPFPPLVPPGGGGPMAG